MPEYLAPGVYVEEVSFRSKSIEGVSTTTTGFVGPTRFGPVAGEPELITSFNQFERMYGGLDGLAFVPDNNFGATATGVHNYLAHAVRAFFDNGGRRLYVARCFRSYAGVNQALEAGGGAALAIPNGQNADGVASASIPRPAPQIAAANAAALAAQTAGRNAITAAGLAAADATSAAVAAITAMFAELGQAVPAGVDLDSATIEEIRGPGAGDTTGPAGSALEGVDISAAVNTVLTDAVAARDAAQQAGEDVDDADAQDHATAISAGQTAGEAAPLPNAAAAAGNAGGAATAATTAADDASTRTAAVAASRGDLSDALAALGQATPANRVDRATAVVTAASAATTAADDAIAPANASVTAATAAAREATIARRAAIAEAVGALRARFPGAAGNLSVTITARLGQNVFSIRGGTRSLSQVKPHDLVLITATAGGTSDLYIAQSAGGTWSFSRPGAAALPIGDLAADAAVRIVSLNVEVDPPGAFAQSQLYTNLTVAPQRLQDGITHVFAATISNRARELETPLILDAGSAEPVDLAASLIGNEGMVALPTSGAAGVRNVFVLSGGNDGVRPGANEYLGVGGDDAAIKSGLRSFEDLEEISIVAAPGSSYGGSPGSAYENAYQTINQQLITHCQTIMRYRVAVLDAPNDQSLSQVRNTRAILDTTYAAFYYPWIRVLDPVTRQPITVPPSGFVTGIYARNDIENGVHKAPANEVLLGAIGLETLINKGQQDVLNPLGINCVRSFEGRGIRLWGARTVSSDPEWKYLNIRRFFVYLEASIERSTQWAVFEPNGEQLWANIRRTVEDFLYNEWASERLAGTKPGEAYFVRCDRTTMTQNDLDNGRLICLIGVAPLYPAEFVIFRIGQWTADRPA